MVDPLAVTCYHVSGMVLACYGLVSPHSSGECVTGNSRGNAKGYTR